MEIIEGIGNEVLFFGLGSVVLSVLLYHVAQFMFRSIEADQTSPGTNVLPGRTRTESSECCICIGDTQLGLETNCGHVYCGDCILEVGGHWVVWWCLEVLIGLLRIKEWVTNCLYS